MYERDNYMPAPKGQARAGKKGMTWALWLQWVVGTTLGAAIGQALAQYVAAALLPNAASGTFLGFVVGIVAGAIMGGVLGIVQGAVLARAIGADGWRDWAIAGAGSGALRWAIFAPISQALMLNVGVGYRGQEASYCILFLAIILFGVLSGLAFGIPQGIILRRRLGEITGLDMPAWVLANAGAALISIPALSLSGLNAGAVAALFGVSVVDLANDPSQYTGPGAAFAELFALSNNLSISAIIAVSVTWALIGILTSFPLRDKLRGRAE